MTVFHVWGFVVFSFVEFPVTNLGCRRRTGTGRNRSAVHKPDLRTEPSCAMFVILHKSHTELIAG